MSTASRKQFSSFSSFYVFFLNALSMYALFVSFIFPFTAFTQDPEIKMPSRVYAVQGVDEDAVLHCELAGFTPPVGGDDGGAAGGDSTGSWSITWRRMGNDFSLVTNYMGITYSRHGDRQISKWSFSRYDKKQWCFDGGGPQRPFPPPLHGKEICTYQFQNISDGSGICSLVIRGFDKDDEGNYTVEIKYKELKTRNVYLHVVEKSDASFCNISANKPDLMREEENEVSLTCTFYGAFPFVPINKMIWKKDQQSIPQRELVKDKKAMQNWQWDRYTIRQGSDKGVNSFDLVIEEIDRKDAGSYFCGTITDVGQPVTCAYKLNVAYAPEISFTIQDNYIAKEGQKRSFECMDQAKSYPTPTLVIEKLGDESRKEANIPLMESENHFLKFSISSTRLSDAGKYRCVANNSEGNSQVTYELFVQYLNVELKLNGGNSTPNESLLVAENETIMIECRCQSYPRAKLRWVNPQGIPINSSDNGEQSLVLMLRNIQRSQSGVYRCLSSINFYDNSNLTKVQQVTINVRNTPRILSVVPVGPLFADEFSQVQLECSFTDGVPSASAKWTFNNVTMPSTRNAHPNNQTSSIVFQASRISRHQAGKYTCLVYNSLGASSYKVVSVVVKFGPEVRFRVEPFDKAIDGENRTFVCEDIAFAYPTPRISLFYTGDSGGSRGEGVSDPNAGLIFTQVAHRVNFTMRVLKSHTKPFVCGAKNKVNSTQSDPLTVDVQFQPIIKLKIEQTEMREGEPLFAQCEAEANPPPRRFYWRMDSTMSEVPSTTGNWDPIGATKYSKIALSISKVQYRHSGTWSCIATNVLHNSRQLTGIQKFNLTVFYPASGIKVTANQDDKPTDHVIVKSSSNNPAELKCIYTDGQPRSTVTWTFSRQAQTSKTIVDRNLPLYQDTRQSIITISDPKDTDSGQYCCNVKNEKFQTVSRCANLTVLFPPDVPQLELQSAQMPVTLPHTAELRCTVKKSKPPAIIRWFVSGVSEEPNSQGHQEVEHHFNSWSIVKLRLKPDNHGQLVWCTSHSESFPSEKSSTKIPLILNYAPVIQNASNAYAMVGERGSVQCTVIARPQAQIFWQRGEIPVTPEYEYEHEIVTKSSSFNDDRTVRSDLIVKQVSEDTRGDYKCIARNKYGPAETIVSILKPNPPILRDSLSAQFLPPNSVNLTWIEAKSEHAMKTWYLVWYHTKVKFSSADREGRGIENSMLNEFSPLMGDLSELGLVTRLQHNYTNTYAVVPRLQPGNFYHLYVQACNDAGCSRSINRVFDFEPSSASVARMISNEQDINEMTILEVTLSLVVGCLTIALCYLIGVLVICVKKIRALEGDQHQNPAELHSHAHNNHSQATLLAHPPQKMRGAIMRNHPDTMYTPVATKQSGVDNHSPKMVIPRSYLAQLDGTAIKESVA